MSKKVFKLSKKDSKVLTEALKKPKPPNENLIKARDKWIKDNDQCL